MSGVTTPPNSPLIQFFSDLVLPSVVAGYGAPGFKDVWSTLCQEAEVRSWRGNERYP